MIPVALHRIRRSADKNGAELMLRIRDEEKAFILHLPLERAWALTIEMHGLATDDLCARHHLASDALKAVGARIDRVILRGTRQGWVVGAIRLETEGDFRDVDVDLPTALAMAVHLGLPIFVDNENTPPESPLQSAQTLTEDTLTDSCASGQIPLAFRKVIEELEFPSHEEEKDA
jgi:bifunctional DNase/RNase